MEKIVLLKCGLIIALLAAASGCGGGGEDAGQQQAREQEAAEPERELSPYEEPQAAAGAETQQTAQGREIFAGKGLCVTCHGQDATGTKLAPNLTDSEWLNIEQPVSQAKIAQLIMTGVPQPEEYPAPMPPRGGAALTDEEVQSVAGYVYSLSR